MADRDTLAILAGEFASAFQPLAAALRSSAAFRDFLADLGWTFTAVPTALDSLRKPVDDLSALVSGGPVDDTKIDDLLKAVVDAFSAISDLSSAEGLSDEFKNEFPKQLIEYLLAWYLIEYQPRWGFLLMALGVIRFEETTATSERGPTELAVCAVEELGSLFADPLAYWKTTYAWGQPSFKGIHLAQAVTGLLEAWGFTVLDERRDPATLSTLTAGATSPESVVDASPEVLLMESSTDPELLGAGVGLFLLPETPSAMPGFALLPFATSDFGEEVEIGDNMSLALQTEIDLTSNLGVFVRPNKDIEFLSGLHSGAPTPAVGELKAVFTLGTPKTPTLILGHPEGSRLEFAGISTTAGVRFDSANKLEAFAEFAFQGGKIAIKPASDDTDSFLADLLPGNGFEVDFGLVVGFSTKRGIYFAGSGGFEICLTANRQVGPLTIVSGWLAVRFGQGSVPIDIVADLRAGQGPIMVSVEKIGLTADFTFPSDRKGNLGPANLELKFKPPTGLGIAIDSDDVTGGGFVSFDRDAGRYFGALELAVRDIAVQAYGLIETKLPGGGYSFLIALSVEFDPAIQLGYGFMLAGIGGLVGINRTVDADVLQRTVRDGTADRLLFPRDLLTNGPKILEEVGALFPSAEDHYVVGPMAKITWLSLITGKLGLFIEFPGPRIVLLGTIQAALPSPDKAAIKLNVDVAGILDFPKKHLEIDASLRDSVIVKIPISGDMALRLDWGDKPNFVMSVGGLNPAYQAPMGFPKLNRVTVDLTGKGANPSISLCGYFAITSNSVQLGAKAEVKASGCGIDLHGWVEFDALFVLSPFSFTATLDAGVKISFHGYGPTVHLHGELSGPSPYHLRGKVSVSILWWDASLSFEKTFGEGFAPVLPDKTGADLLDDVVAEIAKPASWSSTLPANAYVPVRLVPDTHKLEPVGNAVLCQRIAPFGKQISMWKGVKLAQPVQVTVGSAKLGEDSQAELVALRDVQDYFAPGQYFTMTNAQKLSAQPFEKMKAGAVYRHEVETGDTGPGDLDYDEFRLTLGTGGISGPVDGGPPTSDEMDAWTERSDSATSAVRTSTSEKYVAPNYRSTTTQGEDSYVVCDAATQSVLTNLTPQPVSKTEALLALDRYCASTRATRSKYVVIQTEV